ncbi:acyloxyacyl hydrolase [Flavobacterium sp. SUN046]|uniref:acyloxyacyl hydrolase n=1 Tax=Flavobacterium sp. SUN046 TaxID=3002440 RepID=UPI002DB99FFB|nr:acyloxyacyl hydrolase [Flavobacterium sp. SUN046]MEC4049244.1 acyloxyacyl hydrolase [Flavobacterium sp. SUN046]
MRKYGLLLALFSLVSMGQQNKDTYAFEASLLRGNVLPHTEDLYHLRGHPEGFMLSFLKQTHGEKEWHSAYNFPDYGVYVAYQNYQNQFLGQIVSAGLQYNFYFLNRNIELKLSQGMAYATTPYDKVTNSKNKAFGSTLMANTNIGLFYKKEHIIDRFGLQAGFLFTHCSNGRTKSPNSGINTFLVNVGVNYDLGEKNNRVLDTADLKKNYAEPIHYTFVVRAGVNESPIIGSGQHPFYHIGAYADKRFNRKSALQLGTELFLTTSFVDFIKYKSNAYPELHLDPNTDYKRIGVFTGYELFVNKISLEAQLGYYVYQPFKNDISIYDRVGFKYYWSKKVFSSFSVKTHLFLAEALEFGIGVRL